METQEKLIARAQLMASGVIHRSQYEGSKEMHLWLQLLAEELAKIEDLAVVLNIKESLLGVGLRLPELQEPASSDGLDETGAETESTSIMNNNEVESPSQPSPCLYVRRANNQVSEYTEAHIRELLSRGLSKSAIARAIRVNRRVVIRVAHEAQSAQRNKKKRR